jgi:hypothetical protein
MTVCIRSITIPTRPANPATFEAAGLSKSNELSHTPRNIAHATLDGTVSSLDHGTFVKILIDPPVCEQGYHKLPSPASYYLAITRGQTLWGNPRTVAATTLFKTVASGSTSLPQYPNSLAGTCLHATPAVLVVWLRLHGWTRRSTSTT